MSARSETYLHGHHDSVLRSHRWRTGKPGGRTRGTMLRSVKRGFFGGFAGGVPPRVRRRGG